MRHDSAGRDRSPSSELHLRARRFIEGAPGGREAFDALATDLARFQARACVAVGRLYAARGVDPAALRAADEIPAVPTDAFKLTRIAAHAPGEDTVVFRTSGQSPRKHRSVIGGPGTARALRDYLTSVLDSAPATPAPAPAPTPAPAGTVTIAVRADLSALAADLRAAADAIAASQA